MFFIFMWTIFKVFIKFVTSLFQFSVLCFWPRGTWDLSSLTRDQNHGPWTGRRNLNHWTAREVPLIQIFSPFWLSQKMSRVPCAIE